ncbi:Gti1/Pac2 family domain-containing protein [Trichoderma novae-zelandiae]
MSDQPRLTPTFRGFIHDTTDALLLFSACLDGIISHVPRRPHDRERQELIVSGSVFIYEEHASGIKRWTDGISWSPSRILDNFLIYRELQRPFPPGEKKRALKRKRAGHGIQKVSSNNSAPPQELERSLVGSLTDSYDFKGDGLVKKTISINYRGVPHHLVSYYDLDEVRFLATPTGWPPFANVRIRPELYLNQNFRTPVPGMPLMLHPHLQDPNDPNGAAAAGGQALYGMPVTAAASITPPVPTMSPEHVAFTQTMAEMAVSAVDPVYTTSDWFPPLFVTADAPAHTEGQGHNHHHQFQMSQHAELQHHPHHHHQQFQQPQLQQQPMQQQPMQQPQLLNMHHPHQHQLQLSPVQHQHQHQHQQPSPVQNQHQHPGPIEHQHQHHSAMQYHQAQSQQAQNLFSPHQRHSEHRESYQPVMMPHDHADLSLGEDQQNTVNTTQYGADAWPSWFQAPI